MCKNLDGRPTCDFDMDDLRRVTPIPSLNLPDITEKACYEPRNRAPYMVYLCEAAKRYNGHCLLCGSDDHQIHCTLPENRLVHDVNIGNTQIDIYLKVRRHRCNTCGGTFVEPFPSVVESRQMTRRLYEQICSQSFRHSFADVAASSGFSATTIASIFDDYAEELEANRGPVVAPRVLGIDEKHIVHAMRGVFVDIESGRLLEMTEANKESDIVDTITNMVGYDRNIEVVTMDMSNGYRSYIETCLPYAKIVVDRYHVMQALGLRVKRTKAILSEYLSKQVAGIADPIERARKERALKAFAGTAYLFKYNHKNLPGSNIKIMAEVCDTFPEVNHLRLLKEGFERVYECSSRSAAESVYAEWKRLVPGKGSKQVEAWSGKYGMNAELFAEFRSFSNTVHHWHEYIFNYFDEECWVTNAATEGLNRLVDNLNRLGNGYSFRRLRARALFCHEAAPIMRYTAKTLKSRRPDIFTTSFVTDFSMVGVETRTSIVPMGQIPVMEPLTVFNFHSHPIFME